MSQLNINTIKNKKGDYGPNLVGFSTVTGNLNVTGNITGDGSGITNLPAASGDANLSSLVVSGVSTFNSLVVSGVSTFNSDVNINGVLTYQDVTNIDSVGMITARKGIQVLADGINAVGVVTATRFSGGEIVGTSASISGISTFSNKVFIQGTGGGSSTNYASVTLSGLSPSSFNETYGRQATGYVLDTGTISSGNALFHADSNYYYYVATSGSSPDSRMLIWSVEDNNWMVVFNFNGTNYTEGNVSNNQAVGFAGVFNATVTATSQTEDGRSVPTASGSVVYATSGGGSSVVGVTTFGTDGGAIFSGILTSVSYNINSTEVIDSSRNLQNISTGSSTIVTLNSGINTTATSKTVVNREFLEVVSAGTSITLPASPTIGNQVNIAVGNFTDTVVLRNGSKIMGSTDDLTLNTAYVNVQFVYINTNVGWRIN